MTAYELQWKDVSSLRSRKYLADMLVATRRSIGAALLQSVDLERGIVHTWAAVGRQIPEDFSQGGLLPEAPSMNWIRSPNSLLKPISNTRAALAAEVEQYLGLDPRNCCLFANETTDANEPAAERLPARVIYRGELYHLLESGASLNDIDAVIKAAHGVPICIGVLSSVDLADSCNMAMSGVLVEAVFSTIVANVGAIVVGAFDGEGFLVWSRVVSQ